MLEQERGCDRSIPRVHVNGGPVLSGVQEDFGQITVLEPPNASSVIDARLLETEQLVAAPVRQPATSFAQRVHCKSSTLSPGGPRAGARAFDLNDIVSSVSKRPVCRSKRSRI